jgi:NADH:ubiquinone oxidoreductase subunit 5 (subunit L)/multisubunit Na+/H+ antiporter MnhA subunit
MLVVAGATALLGIAHAAVHPDIRGLVAWSSVENAGLITAAYGAALVGTVADDRRLMAAGLLAATAQVVTHSLGKSLLFVSVARLERDGGPTDLDHLRGIGRADPWTAAGLAVGAMTLAGLPLTAGFASEWLILESLMQQFRVDDLAMQLASAAAAALVALTVGVAGVTFVRLVALTAFGPSRDGHRDGGVGTAAAVGLLGLGCLGIAALTPLELTLISRGLEPLVGTVTAAAHAPDRFAIQPVFSGFSSLSPTWLCFVLPAMCAVVLLVASAASRGGLWRVRRVPAWSSASPGTDRGIGYSSFAYANPMRRVLANVLLTRHQMEEVQEAERTGAVRLTAAAGPGADEHAGRRSGPSSNAGGASPGPIAEYQVDVVEVVDRYLYGPGYRALLTAARATTRLQSGRLDAYVAYMLVALIAVLTVVVWLA